MNDNQTPSSSDDLASQALAEAEAAGSTAASPKTNPQVAETLISLQNVIERNALELDTVMAEMKEFRDSLKSIFENDTTLSEVEDEAEKVTQKVKERKTQIQNTLEVNQLKNNIAELKERQKEIEEALNNHLLNLYQVTGTKVFDTSSGEQREFSVRASLKKNKKAE